MNETTWSAAQIALATAGTLFVQALGIEPGYLIFACVGSIVGVTLAKSSGTFYAILLFTAATLICALFATIATVRWFGGDPLYGKAAAVVLGIGFHPMLAWFLELIPVFLRATARRILAVFAGGGNPPPPAGGTPP
jgi:hypothetical protein